MPHARSSLIDLSVTPYYHCIARCVRRAFLCGEDSYTGTNYSHRRDWVEARIRVLADIFAINVCAYAVMSNHLHLVLRVDTIAAEQWDDADVVAHYRALFPMAVQSQEETGTKSVSETTVSLWRERLTNISWFMRTLNEHIARKANEEDNVTGRFWEGRFKSQPILDETGLLTCMAYVDLNPIRANMATSLETSDFTSIQARLLANAKALQGKTTPAKLMPFSDENSTISETLPFRFDDYLVTLTWAIASSSKGVGTVSAPPTLESYGISPAGWADALRGRDVESATFLGGPPSLTKAAMHYGKAWLKGMVLAQRLYHVVTVQ